MPSSAIICHNSQDWLWHGCQLSSHVNSLRPRQNGRLFADDIFRCIFLDENVWIPIWISLNFVSKGPINNILALVQIMAWRRTGDKPLSEAMMVRLPTHLCITRPQWVNQVLLDILTTQKGSSIPKWPRLHGSPSSLHDTCSGVHFTKD